MIRSVTISAGDTSVTVRFTHRALCLALGPDGDVEVAQLFSRATRPECIGEILRAGMEGERIFSNAGGEPVSIEQAKDFLDLIPHQDAFNGLVKALNLGLVGREGTKADDGGQGKDQPSTD